MNVEKMNSNSKDPLIEIKFVKDENFYDFKLIAMDFVEFIKDFEKKYLAKKIFVITAYYKKILAGIIVAEDKRKKINSIEKLVPSTCLHLLYINPNYRNINIGKKLLDAFVAFQKKSGVASIYIKIPHKYKRGQIFLEKFEFHTKGRVGNKIILERKLWNDFGVGDCHMIEDNIEDLF